MDIEEDSGHYASAAAAAAAPAFSDPAFTLTAPETTGAKDTPSSIGMNLDDWSALGAKDSSSSFTSVPTTRRRNPFGECNSELVLYERVLS